MISIAFMVYSDIRKPGFIEEKYADNICVSIPKSVKLITENAFVD